MAPNIVQYKIETNTHSEFGFWQVEILNMKMANKQTQKTEDIAAEDVMASWKCILSLFSAVKHRHSWVISHFQRGANHSVLSKFHPFLPTFFPVSGG